jgi:Flp pilus assembly protein TadG
MKSQKGQAIVETALILPILLMLLFGITDFGRIFHAYLTLDHAGREAARAASVGTEDGVILSKIIEDTSSLNGFNPGNPISPAGKANRESGSNVTITLTYPVDFLTPIIGQIIGEFELKDKTVMRVE